MAKTEQKNNYQKLLEKKRQFAKQVKHGKTFKDSDRDGLSDYEEKNLYGTNPKNPDSDGDGVNDGDEIKRGRNPLGRGKLKNLFIPHKGNNYLPHSLKPGRLLFHALSVLAVKSLVVVFIIFYPLSAWLSPDLALLEAKKIIELTNKLRQAATLPELLENRRLAQAAWQKVQDMALNQYFAHISPAGLGMKNWLNKISYKYSIAGENLAVGFTKPEDVVLAWKNSPTHYENIIDKNFKEIGVALAEGKLNQIDTIFIAQYFAAPASPELAAPINETVVGREPTPVALEQPQLEQPAQPAIQGEKTAISQTFETAAAVLPLPPAPFAKNPLAEQPALDKEILIDQAAAILSVKGDALSQSRILQAEVRLPEDIVSAEVIINSHKITLNKIAGSSNAWQGVALLTVEEEKNITNPLLPASLSMKNSAAATLFSQIEWDEIKTLKTSPLEQYRLFKASPAPAMKQIMDLSAIYFKIILIITLLATILNIFIEIRKQHPHIIFYSLAFLGLLVFAIIF